MLCFIMTVFNFYVLILHLCATIKVILLLIICIVILLVIIRSWGQDPAAEDGMQRRLPLARLNLLGCLRGAR